jgi:alkylhydroperoxidase family enzyme
MFTPRIEWFEDERATGELAGVYRAWLDRNPGRERMPEILKCFSQRPDLLQGVMAMSYQVHFSEGHLTRRVKEMIATYVSALNQCPY